MKVRNLKANHSIDTDSHFVSVAVLASMKVRNLKANHSTWCGSTMSRAAVLASMKVRNLKANHNTYLLYSIADSQDILNYLKEK